MIRNEAEYQHAAARLEEERGRLAEHRDRLKATGLSDDEIKRVIDPIESFHLQLKEEVESYERLKRGEFDELENLRGLGQMLISLPEATIFTDNLAKLIPQLSSDISKTSALEIGQSAAMAQGIAII